MTIKASSHMATSPNSYATGRETGVQILAELAEQPDLVLTYLAVHHKADDYLRGLHDILGKEVPVVGCSAQGIVGRKMVREEGYASGALGLKSDCVKVATACVEGIEVETRSKGQALGRQLREQLPEAARLVLVHYDTMCGVDVDALLGGLHSETPCQIVGGGAASAFGFVTPPETYVYLRERVMTRSAVAVAFCGDFSAEVGICHGCSPVGVEMTVTRSSGTSLLELDGRPAYDVWEEICGTDNTNLASALAIGVPVRPGASAAEYLVRAAYNLDKESGGVILASCIAEGTRVMLHHRSVQDVLDGATQMGADLSARLRGKRVRAVLGFECGSRTRPFLGEEATLKENLALQEAVAPEAAWLGFHPWGEVCSLSGGPVFHNYSYPLLVLAD